MLEIVVLELAEKAIDLFRKGMVLAIRILDVTKPVDNTRRLRTGGQEKGGV